MHETSFHEDSWKKTQTGALNFLALISSKAKQQSQYFIFSKRSLNYFEKALLKCSILMVLQLHSNEMYKLPPGTPPLEFVA